MKNQLETLSIHELQQNVERIEFAVEDLQYLLETLEEEKDELLAANQMLTATFENLEKKEKKNFTMKGFKNRFINKKEEIQDEVKKIIDVHLTPKAKKLFRSANQSPSLMNQEKSENISRFGLKAGQILPKAKRFLVSPGKFLINKLKNLS
jgi:hypothetical protein